MRTVRATIELPALASDAEAVWYDTDRWPLFVDGLQEVLSVAGDWPRPGGSVVWESHRGGRGRVEERSIAYEARRGQESAVEDPEIRGIQRIGFAPKGDGVVVSLELEYEIRERACSRRSSTCLRARGADGPLRRTLTGSATR